MIYDTEQMKKDFTMEEIANIFGIPVNHLGKNSFIRCPVHLKMQGKYDNKTTNCQLTKDHFYCHACHGSGDFFVMVQNYKKVYENETIGFEQVCQEIADKSENPDFYILSKEKIKEKKKAEPTIKIPITEAELELIGLDSSFKTTFLPKTCQEEKPKNSYAVISDPDCYVICDHTKYNIKDFYREEPEMFRELVYQKAWDKKEVIETWLKDENCIKVIFNENADGVIKSLIKMLASVNSIIERFSKQEEEKETLKKENRQNLYNSIFSISTKHNKNGLF